MCYEGRRIGRRRHLSVHRARLLSKFRIEFMNKQMRDTLSSSEDMNAAGASKITTAADAIGFLLYGVKYDSPIEILLGEEPPQVQTSYLPEVSMMERQQQEQHRA